MSALARIVASAAAALTLIGHPTPVSSRQFAYRDAGRLVRLAVLPPGAHRVPSGASVGTRGPFQVPLGARRVDRYRFWRVEEPLASVIAFVRTHRPRGAGPPGYATGGGRHTPPGETVFFAYPAQGGRTSGRWLALSMIALRDGSTGVTADAQEIWVVPRPASEVVPTGVREIDVHTPSRLLRLTDRAEIARIVHRFDRLPTVQPGLFNCTLLVAGPKLGLVFRSAGGGVLARASFAADSPDHSLLSSRCTPISFSVAGRRQRPLVGGTFLPQMQRLLGERLLG